MSIETLTHSLHPSDTMQGAFLCNCAVEVDQAVIALQNQGYAVQHQHRLWEYASALHAWDLLLGDVRRPGIQRALEVGGGRSPFRVIFEKLRKVHILNVDPDSHPTPWNLANSLEDVSLMLARDFDAVFSISTIEHIKKESEHWCRLAGHVNVGGLLFVTCDVVSDRLPHRNDFARITNYTPEDLQDRGKMLEDRGFAYLGGEPDWSYRGNFVFDYSFFSLAMVRLP